MENIDFMTASDEELQAYLKAHPARVRLLRHLVGLDEKTLACLACMAENYNHGGTDAEALEIFNKALAFYGRKPVTTGPKITG